VNAPRGLAKKVFVVWPPVWNAFDAHVAVPTLCGYLVRQGIPVRQLDLNIDFFRYLVAEETIERQLNGHSAPLPKKVESAVDFARRYFEIRRSPLQPGYRQRVSEDAEQHLLARALEIFNHFHPQTAFSTLGIYHAGNADSSDFIADFAAGDAGNPFAAFYRGGFLPALEDELPSVVGISICGSFQLGAAFTLARMIKEIEPRIRVVCGGAFFSTMPQALLVLRTADNLFRHVDAYVLNEGERPFLRLIREVFSKLPPQPGPNLVLNGQRELSFEPQDCLPPAEIATPVFPDDAIPKYFRPVRRIPVEVSRGCYWGKCTFCNLAQGANERYRGIPAEQVYRSVQTLTEQHEASEVLFSTLAMAPKILRGLAQRLNAGSQQIRWNAWIRPESGLTREDFISCRKAGCTSLSVTPESFNDRTLARMRKGTNADQLIRIISDLRYAGLCGGINLIPGFPGETQEDFFATLEICRDLGLRGEFFPFHLLKNSPIYRDPKGFGVLLRENPANDLAVEVPYVYARDPEAPTGIELIKAAAWRYPRQVFADDPLGGYTFDFTAEPSPVPAVPTSPRNQS